MKKIEHNNHCTQIAETLAKYANGVMAKCPNCGEVFENAEECPYCEEELEEIQDYFEELATRFPNLREEFEENAIL